MKWVSVKDKLPKYGIKYRYLFINVKNEVTYGYAYNPIDGWYTDNKNTIWINDMDRDTNEIATHWMPLPQDPKEIIIE